MDRKAIDLAKEKINQVMDVEVSKQVLINQGYSAGEADDIVNQALLEIEEEKKRETRKRKKDLTGIEFLDRTAFGMSSVQYINIFAYIFGANLFLIGLAHSIINSLQLFFTFVLENGSKLKRFFTAERSKFLAILMLLIMAYFALIKNFYGLLVALILYSLFISFYNIRYPRKSLRILKVEKRDFILRNIVLIGVMITSLGIYLGGWFLDYYMLSNFLGLHVFGYQLNPPALIFAAAAFLLLISEFILLKYRKESNIQEQVVGRVSEKIRQAFKFISNIKANKNLLILFLGSSFAFMVSLLVNSYLGIFIYTRLSDFGFGAFRNVAIIFIIAIISSLIGPWVVRKNAAEIGKLPLLIFGSLLTAILPFALFLNKGFTSMALATLLGILGSSISESALGLTFMDIIRTETRKLYFNSIRMLLWLPTLILSAIGAFIAFQFGLKVLFLGLAIIQIGLVFPLYFALLIIESRKKVIL
jgi:uncharacterized protein YoaH (UPF0181 family)